MASTDSLPMPRKNVAFRVVFPILDADGDLVTGATGLDSEISKDQGTFTDCTNEATEIATASGMYYLDLTSTEMNADSVAIIVKTTSVGAKTTPLTLYPAEATDIPVNITGWNGTAVAAPDTAGYPKVTIKDGTGTGEIDTTSGKVAIADGAIGAATFAANALTASALATDAVTEIVTALLTTQMTEAYAADGVAPTLAQSLFQLLSACSEFAIVGTSIICKKLDGSTTAMTFTIDSATDPTSRTRAS